MRPNQSTKTLSKQGLGRSQRLFDTVLLVVALEPVYRAANVKLSYYNFDGVSFLPVSLEIGNV
jgi:hypothetical protein